jgi:uncharacterized RDD family membrane protein YckC
MYAPPQAFAAPVSAGLNYFSPAVGQTMYAGFWLRVCACVIDWFVIGLPFYLVGRLFVSPQPVFFPGRPVAFPPDFFMGSCALPLVHLVADWLYYALMESSVRQATLGKLALGLRVTDGAGRPITFGRATGRHFAKYLSALTLGIGYMMAGWTQRKQALHDLVADTLVWRG